MRGEDNFVEVTLGMFKEIAQRGFVVKVESVEYVESVEKEEAKFVNLNTEREHTVKNSVVSNSRYLGTKIEGGMLQGSREGTPDQVLSKDGCSIKERWKVKSDEMTSVTREQKKLKTTTKTKTTETVTTTTVVDNYSLGAAHIGATCTVLTCDTVLQATLFQVKRGTWEFRLAK